MLPQLQEQVLEFNVQIENRFLNLLSSVTCCFLRTLLSLLTASCSVSDSAVPRGTGPGSLRPCHPQPRGSLLCEHVALTGLRGRERLQPSHHRAEPPRAGRGGRAGHALFAASLDTERRRLSPDGRAVASAGGHLKVALKMEHRMSKACLG